MFAFPSCPRQGSDCTILWQSTLAHLLLQHIPCYMSERESMDPNVRSTVSSLAAQVAVIGVGNFAQGLVSLALRYAA